MEWTPIAELPPPGDRLGKYWIIVEGSESHSGGTWPRQAAGLAATNNDGFCIVDVKLIASRDSMDRGTPFVSHFMPIDLPPFPSITHT